MHQSWAQTLSYGGIRLQRQGNLDMMYCQRPEYRDRLALPHKRCCWMEGRGEHCGYEMWDDSHVSHSTCDTWHIRIIMHVRKPNYSGSLCLLSQN